MLIQRELGAMPISVSTALALEALFMPEEEKPSEYKGQSLWFNIRTLYRNLISTIIADQEYDNKMVISDLLEEINVIGEILSDYEVCGKNKIVFYINSHQSLSKLFPHAKLKMPKTQKQVTYFDNEKIVLEAFIKNFTSTNNYDVKIGDYMLEGDDANAIVLTHMPIDLLSRYKFSSLLLLESHTGKLKPQSAWNSKLTGGVNNHRIPFNSLTLQVIGDNSTNFYSFSLIYKKALLTLAKESNWSTMTGSEKFLNDVATLKNTDPFVYGLFSKLTTKKMFF